MPDIRRGAEHIRVDTEPHLLLPVALSPALGQTGAALTTVRGHGSFSTGDFAGGHTGASVVIPHTLLLLQSAGLFATQLFALPAVFNYVVTLQVGGVLLVVTEVYLGRNCGIF